MDDVSRIIENDIVGNASFGIECVWLIEDYYERKNLRAFLSLVCDEYNKKTNLLETRLKDQFDAYEDIKLFLYVRSKVLDIDLALHAYEICWSKRCKRFKSDAIEKSSGTATIVLKRKTFHSGDSFYLFDIKGDNPFV